MCNSTFVPALYTMYVHEGITLTKRQSARLIRTIDIKITFTYLHRTNCALCSYYIKSNTLYYSKRSIYSSLKPLVPTESFSLLSLSLESERITDSSKTLHKLKKKHPKLFLTFQCDVLPQICKIRHSTTSTVFHPYFLCLLSVNRL